MEAVFKGGPEFAERVWYKACSTAGGSVRDGGAGVQPVLEGIDMYASAIVQKYQASLGGATDAKLMEYQVNLSAARAFGDAQYGLYKALKQMLYILEICAEAELAEGEEAGPSTSTAAAPSGPTVSELSGHILAAAQLVRGALNTHDGARKLLGSRRDTLEAVMNSKLAGAGEIDKFYARTAKSTEATQLAGAGFSSAESRAQIQRLQQETNAALLKAGAKASVANILPREKKPHIKNSATSKDQTHAGSSSSKK